MTHCVVVVSQPASLTLHGWFVGAAVGAVVGWFVGDTLGAYVGAIVVGAEVGAWLVGATEPLTNVFKNPILDTQFSSTNE